MGGLFAALSGLEFTGYEIHMGLSDTEANLVRNGNVYGTYLHGLFDSEGVARAVVSALFEAKGIDPAAVSAFNMEEFKESQYDKLAEALRAALDMRAVYKILQEGI